MIPLLVDDSPAWQALGACTKEDPELFFPPKGGHTVRAKKICSRCPVQTKCLDWIMKIDTDNGSTSHGVYGGLTIKERHRLRKGLVTNGQGTAGSEAQDI
jgi:WhiB family redox-sensing transcriptional regulator